MAKIITQLGKSRKYANGTIHENASGKFQILDRFLDDGIVMLNFQWLTGENEGKIDTNKEENVNASIYKYEQSRGLLGNVEENREVVTLSDIYKTAQECCRILKWYEEDRHAILNELALMDKKIHAQTELLNSLTDQVLKDRNILNDLTETGIKNDENIRTITNIVDKNTTMMQTMTNNIDLLSNQQKLIDKLLEKI